MSMTKFIFAISLLTICTAQAENHLLMLGGGGEPRNDTTVFDDGLIDFSRNLKSSNWKYEVSFNGGHQETEKILRKHYSQSVKPTTNFTQKNFLNLIASYKNKILSGEIKSGDQLMIIISTHGAEASKNEATHSIALSGGAATDLNNLAGASLASLDTLEELVKLTNARGIKLGIIDLSCHSGATLALKKNAPNTCIVSASGPNHYGFAGPGAFTNLFLRDLKPGVSLEDAFLKARRETIESSFPMISTSEGNQIVNDVYPGITPYLYYYQKNTDKLTPYILENDGLAQICKREHDFKQLISQIDKLNSIVSTNRNSFNADKLKSPLSEYKKNQDNLFTTSIEMGSLKLDNVENFSVPLNSKDLLSRIKIKYTWKELLEFNVEKRIAEYENYKQNSTAKNIIKDHQLVIDFLKKIKVRQQQILTENPNLLIYKKHITSMIENMNNSYKLAQDIALQEKKLYQELYSRSPSTNPNDPCKKIIF